MRVKETIQKITTLTNHDSLLHSDLQTCKEIKSICEPLWNNFGIYHFRYVRCYPDGSFITLATNMEWQFQLLDKRYIDLFDADFIWNGEPTTYLMWDSLYDDKQLQRIVNHANQGLDLGHGLCIFKRYDDYVEVFNFATKSSANNVNNIYLGDKSVFERFILYFKDQAKEMIDEAEQYPIVPPNSPLARKSINHNTINKVAFDRCDFCRHTPIKHIHLSGRYEDISLSYPEIQCLYYLLKEMHYKEIARKICVSPRTVEARLNRIRAKLSCKSKADLIKTIKQEKIDDLVVTVCQ